MSRSDLSTMVLPNGVRAAVVKLQAAIEVAETKQAMNMAVQRAEGFVLGLETAGAFRADVIEKMYVGFEETCLARQLALRDDSRAI